MLGSPYEKDFLDKICEEQFINEKYCPFGDGHAADVIINGITNIL